MAETAKTQVKPVEVTYDAEGTPTVKHIEEPQVEEETQEESEEGVEDSTEEVEPTEETQEESEEGDTDGSEEESEESDDSEEEESSDEDDNVEEVEPQEESEDDEVVSYDELPETVQQYLDFLEETGGSIQDFIEVNRDWDSVPQDEVIRKYLKKTNPYLDLDDIEYEIETQFGISDADSDAEVRAKKVAKKKFYGEAMKSLKADGEKYKADLGSSAALPAQAREAIKFQKEFQAQQDAAAKVTASRVQSFVKNTNKVLGKNFKGFEVKVGEDTLTYKPSDVKKTREENLNVNNLLGRFTDKEGNVTDVEGYHRALTFASNPDAIAAHFFELGKAAQLEEESKGSKNIKMDAPRKTMSQKDNSKAKFKFVDVNPTQSKNARIKLRNY